jgi:hypothetical protein
MKKFYVAAAFLALGLGSKAQTVLLSEDFQGSLANIQVSYPSVLTADPDWYDYDEDGLADASGAGRPNEFYLAYAFAIADSLTGTGDTNTVMASNSWTNNFSTSVRNWLISPNVMIPAGATSAVLKFKTAPFQTPLYCDGFTVRVSTTNNDLASFSAPLFFGAEYSDEGGAYPSYGGDWALYEFKNPYTNAVVSPSSSFVHGWDGSTHQMAEIEDNGDSSRWRGILTQNTLNLGAYVGQNIFFAIIHETHDDNIFGLDDISVEVVTGIDATNAITKINTYPNPTVDYLTVEYTSETASPASFLNVTDMSGRIVYTQSLGMMNAGVNKIQIDATGFANGTYNVDIKTDKGLGKVSFIKK